MTGDTDEDWGVIDEEGKFRPYPKPPLINAGLGPPPFDVVRPDGLVLRIVTRPREVG